MKLIEKSTLKRIAKLKFFKILRKELQRLTEKPQYGFLRDCYTLKKYSVGQWSHGHFGIKINSPEGGNLTIGNFCSIAPGVTVNLGGEHRTDWISSYDFPNIFKEHCKIECNNSSLSKGNVVIENDVWIGLNSTIMSGVTLCNGMVVGAGSVVRRSFPPYSIVAGNPAKLIGYRFPKEIINELLIIKWWEWPIEKILQNLPMLLSTDYTLLIKKYGTSGKTDLQQIEYLRNIT